MKIRPAENCFSVSTDGRMYTTKLTVALLQLSEKNQRYRGADKSLALPGRKQATATEDFDVHISYL